MDVIPVAASDAGVRYVDSDDDSVPALVSISHGSAQIVAVRQAAVAAKAPGAIKTFKSQQPRAQQSAESSPAHVFMARTQAHSHLLLPRQLAQQSATAHRLARAPRVC